MASDVNTPEHPAPALPPQATFGMKRAAEVAGVSVSTIRRNKELLRTHGAVISPDGWQVPITALVASGLMRRQTPAEPMESAPQVMKTAHDSDAQEVIRRLELETMELRHRAELAEERQRSAEQRAQDARELAQALSEALEIERRMLTAGTSTPTPSSQPQKGADPGPLSSAPAPDARKSWWRRTFG